MKYRKQLTSKIKMKLSIWRSVFSFLFRDKKTHQLVHTHTHTQKHENTGTFHLPKMFYFGFKHYIFIIRKETVQIYWCSLLHILLFYYSISQAAVCDCKSGFCPLPLVLWPTLKFDESVDQIRSQLKVSSHPFLVFFDILDHYPAGRPFTGFLNSTFPAQIQAPLRQNSSKASLSLVFQCVLSMIIRSVWFTKTSNLA